MTSASTLSNDAAVVNRQNRNGLAPETLEYRYDVPFKFTGKIDKLTFKLEPEQKAEAKP
jgi:hypothetical protein